MFPLDIITLNILTIESDFNIGSSFLYQLFFILNFLIFNMKIQNKSMKDFVMPFND
jgi:hypothetical protein